MKNIWSMALSPIMATANQRAIWLPPGPGGSEELRGAEDEGDPAPGPQVREHVVGVGGEYVGVGDRGDAVDQVEAADDQEEGRQQDQAVAVAFRVAPGSADSRRG